MLRLNINNIAIVTIKNVDYRCITHSISKSEAINLLNNSALEGRGYIYTNFFLKFQSIQNSLFLPFLFSIYKMVDSIDIYKSLNISIRRVIKNPEMLKITPDNLKTKKNV